MFKNKKQKHVLLAGNDDQAQKSIHHILEVSGYKVTMVHSVATALEIAQKKPQDVIIGELEISGKGGIYLHSQLKSNKKTANVPFIFLTAGDPLTLKNVVRQNDMIVTKPVQSGELCKKIERLTSPQKVKKGKKIKKKASEKTAKVIRMEIPMTGTPATTARKTALMQLPMEAPTRHFTDPDSLFELKQVRASFRKVLRLCRAGKQIKISPIQFPSISPEWEYPLLPVPLPVKQMALIDDVVFDELEVMDDIDDLEEDLTWDIEEIPDEQAIKESKDTEKIVRKEEKPEDIQRMNQLVPEHTLDGYTWLTFHREEKTLTGTDKSINSVHQAEQSNRIIHSMAAMCFQMLKENSQIDYISVNTEKSQIILADDKEQSSYRIAVSPKQ